MHHGSAHDQRGRSGKPTMIEEGNETVLLELPEDFPYSDLLGIAAILRRADVFVPGFIPADIGLYDIRGYLFAAQVSGKSLILLPDRNIVSRLAKVTLGQPVDHQQRMAAAVLAFAQCLDILLEPSIAFHELAPAQGNEAAYDELARFRAADNMNPRHWIDLALGRTDKLPVQAICAVDERSDLSKPLHRWRMNYVVALKIGELELCDIKPLERVLRLFEWMYQDFILAGPAAMFACHYFSPSFPRKRLLKGLRSADRSRALAGVANATWDITHLSDFVRRINEPLDTPTHYMFASLDEGLRRIAGTLITPSESAHMAGYLRAWWSPSQAEIVANSFFGFIRRGRDPSWHENHRDRPNAIAEFIAAGESSICAWSPTN